MTVFASLGLLCKKLRLAPLILLLPALALSADDREALREKLLTRIDLTQQQLEAELLEKNQLEKQLRQIESERVSISGELADIEAALDEGNQHLQQLQQDYHSNSQRGTALEQQLEEIIRLNYRRLAYAPLRILLESENKRSWTRHLIYLRDISAAQWQVTSKARNVNLALAELITKQHQTQQRMAEKLEEKQQRIAKLAQLGQKRLAALEQLVASLAGAEAKLGNYRRLSHRLEEIAASIGELHLDELVVDEPFASLRGRLSLPVNGSVLAHSAQQPGMSIAAAFGEPVQAIAAGQVVYANWITGLGLVLILEHGDDYLSLYAHNQRFSTQTGDWVRPGQVIAYVGDSGGGKQPMLWLQLFHKGQPLSPDDWFVQG